MAKSSIPNIQVRFAGRSYSSMDELLADPLAVSGLEDLQRRHRLGLLPPPAGVHVVKGFQEPVRNRLQGVGRALYCRNPARMAWLLPVLGR